MAVSNCCCINDNIGPLVFLRGIHKTPSYDTRNSNDIRLWDRFLQLFVAHSKSMNSKLPPSLNSKTLFIFQPYLADSNLLAHNMLQCCYCIPKQHIFSIKCRSLKIFYSILIKVLSAFALVRCIFSKSLHKIWLNLRLWQ